MVATLSAPINAIVDYLFYLIQAPAKEDTDGVKHTANTLMKIPAVVTPVQFAVRCFHEFVNALKEFCGLRPNIAAKRTIVLRNIPRSTRVARMHAKSGFDSRIFAFDESISGAQSRSDEISSEYLLNDLSLERAQLSVRDQQLFDRVWRSVGRQ
jgi:hypothetical protein